MTALPLNLGFQGAGFISDLDGNYQVLMANGSIAEQINPAYFEAFDISNNASFPNRSKIFHADGTSFLSGSISFDVTKLNMTNFLNASKMLTRNYVFSVDIYDGNYKKRCNDCYANSVTISGSSEGLISSSINFFASSYTENPDPSNNVLFNRNPSNGGTNEVPNLNSNPPMGYWYAGMAGFDIKNWTLTYTQNVSPVFLNQDSMYPKYFKIGKTAFTLRLTSYSQIPTAYQLSTKSLIIGTSGFTIKGTTIETGYNFGGQNSIGEFTHTFESAALNVSNAAII